MIGELDIDFKEGLTFCLHVVLHLGDQWLGDPNQSVVDHEEAEEGEEEELHRDNGVDIEGCTEEESTELNQHILADGFVTAEVEGVAADLAQEFEVLQEFRECNQENNGCKLRCNFLELLEETIHAIDDHQGIRTADEVGDVCGRQNDRNGIQDALQDTCG